jgi:hypothetical protein
MKKDWLKKVIFLTVLFYLDVSRPLGYSLHLEFTFVGIVFIALKKPTFASLSLSVLFGYFKDCLSMENGFFSLMEFPLIVLVANYFLKNFQKRLAKICVFCSIIILHIILCTYRIGVFFPTFSLYFFLNSILLLVLLEYLFKDWLRQENSLLI